MVKNNANKIYRILVFTTTSIFLVDNISNKLSEYYKELWYEIIIYVKKPVNINNIINTGNFNQNIATYETKKLY